MDLQQAAHHPIQAAAHFVSTMPEPARMVSHVTAGVGIISGFMHSIPTVVAFMGSLMAMCWWGLQLYSHPKVQEWLKRRRKKKEDVQ